jgi:hypothetical protein
MAHSSECGRDHEQAEGQDVAPPAYGEPCSHADEEADSADQHEEVG